LVVSEWGEELFFFHDAQGGKEYIHAAISKAREQNWDSKDLLNIVLMRNKASGCPGLKKEEKSSGERGKERTTRQGEKGGASLP